MGKNALTMSSPAIKKYFCDTEESYFQREGFVRVDKPMPPSTTMEDQLLSNDAGKILFQGKTDLKDNSHSYQRATSDIRDGISEGLALIKRDDDLFCFITNTGTIVIPCKFKEATVFSEGLAAVAVEVDPKKK
jgi:WG containing repeat